MNKNNFILKILLSFFLFSFSPSVFASRAGILLNTIIQDPDFHTGKWSGLKYENIEYPIALKDMVDATGRGPFTQNLRATYSERILPNSDGNFIFQPGTYECRIASVFSNVLQSYEMISQDIKFLQENYPRHSGLKKKADQWVTANGFGPMYIYSVDISDRNNAYYSRGSDGKRELVFLPISTQKGEEPKYTSDSSEIIRHEAGHSILDILRPEFYDHFNGQLGALHESFGDLMALWGTLYNWRITDYIAETTGLDLSKSSPLALVAEQFGSTLGMGEGLRDISSDLSIHQAGDEVHDASVVFTGALYDILQSGVKFLKEERLDKYRNNKAGLLYDASQYTRRLLLQTLLTDSTLTPTFEDIGRTMISVVEHHPASLSKEMALVPWEEYITYEFERRGLMGPDAKTNLRTLDKRLKITGKRICASLVEDGVKKPRKSNAERFIDKI